MCQAKPVNYTGAFAAAGDDLLTSIWYTGKRSTSAPGGAYNLEKGDLCSLLSPPPPPLTAVYTVRLNLEEAYFGAVLVRR